jgi:hypothetical protein
MTWELSIFSNKKIIHTAILRGLLATIHSQEKNLIHSWISTTFRDPILITKLSPYFLYCTSTNMTNETVDNRLTG